MYLLGVAKLPFFLEVKKICSFYEGKPVLIFTLFTRFAVFFPEITVPWECLANQTFPKLVFGMIPWSQSGWSLDGIYIYLLYVYMHLGKIIFDMETLKMKVSKMIAVCLIVENFRFRVIFRGCRPILDIIYIYIHIHIHILTY